MTRKEFYNAIVTANLNDELTAFALDALEKMDNQNARNRERNAERRAAKLEARAEVLAQILAVMTNEPKTATTLIAEAGVEVTPQAVSVMLRPAVAEGTVRKEQVKIAGKGTHVGYVKA